jgi:3',5'-cyclic AMP phosphodiesterase CpdA
MAWLSRRGFLISGAVTLAAQNQLRTRWALLSDTHIPANANDAYRGFQPVANLAQVAPQVAAAGVEGALICGDLARLTGAPGDYGALRSGLNPISGKMPVAFALGNHDDRKNFLQEFGGQTGAQSITGKHVLALDLPAVRFLVLDSLLQPNVTPGLLGRAQREWLVRYLAEAPPRPTLVFVHHTLEDNDGSLLDAERLFSILRGHRSVKAIVYGHSHRYHYDTFDGIHLLNLPAVGYNFSDDQPDGRVEADLAPTAGRFTLRSFGGNQQRNGQTVELAWR